MNFIIYVCSLLYLILISKKSMYYLQQNFYNENNRYLKWGIYNINKVFNILDILILILNFINLFIQNKVFIYINLIYIVLFIIEYINNKNEQVKLPFKITKRIIRLIVTIIIIYTGLLLIRNVYIFNFIYSLMISLSFIIVYLANIINYPVEKLVYLMYKNKATSKLKSMNNLEVIGITGSYGKTSSKNILNTILNVKFNSITTPENYNTRYGLIITINNYINKFNEIFIAEMGAFKRGSIKKLCNLVKPKYGIITNIGTAHLETFGSRENIQKGKFELVESLPSDGLAILNADDEYQVNYEIKNNCPVIWIGINNKKANIVASNIKIDSNGMSFDVKFKDDTKKYTFTTKLLGKANIYNILAAIAFSKFKGMTIDEIKLGVNKIEPIKHRLELKEYDKYTIIDDAYNSNPVGSKMALDVLNLMPGYKVVITPGMIELGELQDKYNKEFGKYISEVADLVILVGKSQTKPIYEGLISNNYDKNNIIVINDVKESFKIIENLKTKKDIYVLIENDLPDIFNEK